MNSSAANVPKMKHEAKERFATDFRYLGELLKTAVTHPFEFIEQDQVATFRISLTDFSLVSDTASNAVPRLFKPFPHDLMEESFKPSSEFEDDLGWPPYEPKYLYPFSEALVIEGTLGKYHRYMMTQWEEDSSDRSMWRVRQ